MNTAKEDILKNRQASRKKSVTEECESSYTSSECLAHSRSVHYLIPSLEKPGPMCNEYKIPSQFGEDAYGIALTSRTCRGALVYGETMRRRIKSSNDCSLGGYQRIKEQQQDKKEEINGN
ncbi:hypothetical protein CEXT_203601 [Caerostris extrusa]|uniref:Uncharacterized protein n=1 Tax=Caerostris extrusa TaxID=172846 RepID=A0AAV4N3A3_CAEEX|nr:hypothetical protein CEXT_203601 [Caerostris extrusa]